MAQGRVDHSASPTWPFLAPLTLTACISAQMARPGATFSLDLLFLSDPETLPNSRWTPDPSQTPHPHLLLARLGLRLSVSGPLPPYPVMGPDGCTPTGRPGEVTYGPGMRSQSPLHRQACLVICEPFRDWHWPGFQGEEPPSVLARPQRRTAEPT